MLFKELSTKRVNKKNIANSRKENLRNLLIKICILESTVGFGCLQLEPPPKIKRTGNEFHFEVEGF